MAVEIQQISFRVQIRVVQVAVFIIAREVGPITKAVWVVLRLELE